MLRGTFRQLIRTTAGYSLNTLVGPIFTLLLTPLYTRALGTAGYGMVDTLVMFGTIVYLLGTLGLTTALPALYYDPQRASQGREVLASAFWAALLWSGTLGLLVVLAAVPLSLLTLGHTNGGALVVMTGASLPFGVIYGLQTVVLRLRFAVRRANLLALLYILVSAGANVLFVVVLRWGVTGVIAAYASVNLVMGLISLALAPDCLRAWPERALLRQCVLMGLPVLPALLANWLLSYEDRLFLVHLGVPFAEIGLYSIAVKLASMLGVLIAPFQSAWGPLALTIQQQPSAPRTYAKVLTYYCVGGLGLGLALGLFAHEVLLLFTTPAFAAAAPYVWLLALVPLTSGLSTVLTVGLFIERRLGSLSWATLLAVLINTVLNVLLIPPLGVLGASVATAVGYLAVPLLSARVAQQLRPFPFEWRRAATVFAVYLVLMGLGLLVGSRLDLLSLGLRAVLLLAYLPLLGLLGLFEPWELRLVGQALRQPDLVLRWVRGRGA